MVAAGFDEIRVRYGTHLVAALIAALGEWGTRALPAVSPAVCSPARSPRPQAAPWAGAGCPIRVGRAQRLCWVLCDFSHCCQPTPRGEMRRPDVWFDTLSPSCCAQAAVFITRQTFAPLPPATGDGPAAWSALCLLLAIRTPRKSGQRGWAPTGGLLRGWCGSAGLRVCPLPRVCRAAQARAAGVCACSVRTCGHATTRLTKPSLKPSRTESRDRLSSHPGSTVVGRSQGLSTVPSPRRDPVGGGLQLCELVGL